MPCGLMPCGQMPCSLILCDGTCFFYILILLRVTQNPLCVTQKPLFVSQKVLCVTLSLLCVMHKPLCVTHYKPQVCNAETIVCSTKIIEKFWHCRLAWGSICPRISSTCKKIWPPPPLGCRPCSVNHFFRRLRAQDRHVSAAKMTSHWQHWALQIKLLCCILEYICL